ncbi:coiled-coil domain-containing protein 146 [Ambystoma mexicanum]|uniref:coiled-coil domain-containing protein 146 n=1 Tax=Ambystoma mexicanum TaxID=8296 RepID=UPI0037E8EA4D
MSDPFKFDRGPESRTGSPSRPDTRESSNAGPESRTGSPSKPDGTRTTQRHEDRRESSIPAHFEKMMTSTEHGNSYSSDSEEEYEEQPLHAIAPTFNTEEKGLQDVSASPAFKCLDELFASGKIPGTRVAELKSKYKVLHETLKSIQESEIQLLQDAKGYTVELEQQQRELEKADQFPEVLDSEVSNMRVQLLKYRNDLNAIEQREYQMKYKLDYLLEEKKQLQRECERIPKSTDVEKKTKVLKQNCEELTKENAQRRLEIKALKEDVSFKQKQIQKEQKDIEKKIEQQEILKNDLVHLQSIPPQLAKEMEKIHRKITEAEKKKAALEEQCQELISGIRMAEVKNKTALEEKELVMKELEEKRALLESKEQEFNQLTKLSELAKENEAMALGERASIELNFRHGLMEKHMQHESLTRRQREKERELRSVKKAEFQLKFAQEGLLHTQSHLEKIKLELDAYPKDDVIKQERKKELRKEVERIKREVSHQHTLTEVEIHMVEQCIAEEEKLVKEQDECREEVVNLTRLAQIKAVEREQKSRDYKKAQQRNVEIVQEIKGKDVVIAEHHRKNQELQKRLKDFAELYDIIRSERNKCVSLLQTAAQRTAEMQEKIKILGNEIEILRTNATNKERLLQKSKLKEANNHVIRDSLIRDLAKVNFGHHEMKQKKEQQKLEIGRLTNMINQIEEIMMQLRKKYENVIQERNERGVQLIEREEEVCIFYEKINIQDMLTRNGDIEIQAMDEKIRFLKMKLVEESRQIEQARKNVPNKKALESELVTQLIQFSQCHDKVNELEKSLENPATENRTRLLDGKDPSVNDLLKKTDELELSLAEKEEQLLEKDFIYEHVSRLADRIRKKAENGKQDTLLLAKKVNELQKKIKEATRKMMSHIAELSMQQASTMKLQQEIRDKEQFLELCYSRIEQGLPPSEDTENEWMRIIRDEKRHKLESIVKAKLSSEEEQRLLPNGVFTTADQRPNAYIPDDASALPLPRPYGGLAPFKPSEPGSNIRHIRKPAVKPIEI